MSITKSIRFESDELEDVQRVVALMPGASEAAALKHLVLLGLQAEKRDLAVLLYTRDGLSTGEIAERLGLSRLEVLHVMEERHVKVLDLPAEALDRALARSDLEPGDDGGW